MVGLAGRRSRPNTDYMPGRERAGGPPSLPATVVLHAPGSHRHRHELGPHDRGAGTRRSVLRGDRSREGDGTPRGRGPRRQEPDAAAAMSAALLALARFRRIAESHGVDEILAAATSATREAENAGEFLARIVEETGIRPRVISGTEEARLIHLAAVYGVDVMRGPAVVIDIGGGSVEITLGNAENAAARPQLQDGRHPAHRTVRHIGSARRARRAKDGAVHQPRDRGARGPVSWRRASIASSARRAPS